MKRIFYSLLGLFVVTAFTLLSLSIATKYKFGNLFIFAILVAAGLLLGDVIKDFVEGN